MRHGKKFNHLGRTKPHREAMLANMACSLIEHKRINTTVAKAKALRKYVEPLITKSKTDSTHSRRVCFSYLKNKYAVTELFREIAPKVAEREGGYTRIIKTGFRLGDSADMCMIELVDFNEIYGQKEKKKTRRSRRGGAKKVTAAATKAVETATEETAEASSNAAEVVKEVAVDADQAVADKVDEAKDVKDAVDADQTVADKVDEAKDEVEEATDDSKDESDEKKDQA